MSIGSQRAKCQDRGRPLEVIGVEGPTCLGGGKYLRASERKPRVEHVHERRSLHDLLLRGERALSATTTSTTAANLLRCTSSSLPNAAEEPPAPPLGTPRRRVPSGGGGDGGACLAAFWPSSAAEFGSCCGLMSECWPAPSAQGRAPATGMRKRPMCASPDIPFSSCTIQPLPAQDRVASGSATAPRK
jgi:hypothetical protein